MSEYQKMISSQPYNCMAPELAQLRLEAARRYRRFNQAEEDAEQRTQLAELVGELAENAFICPPSTAPMAAISSLARTPTSIWGRPCWTMPPSASVPT